MAMYYVAIIHQDPDRDFGVSFPDFPGCITAGRTLDETKALALEALTGHIGVLRGGGTCARTILPLGGDERPPISGRHRVSYRHQRASVSEFKLTGQARRPETIGFHLFIRHSSLMTILVGQGTPRLCCQNGK